MDFKIGINSSSITENLNVLEKPNVFLKTFFCNFWGKVAHRFGLAFKLEVYNSNGQTVIYLSKAKFFSAVAKMIQQNMQDNQDISFFDQKTLEKLIKNSHNEVIKLNPEKGFENYLRSLVNIVNKVDKSQEEYKNFINEIFFSAITLEKDSEAIIRNKEMKKFFFEEIKTFRISNLLNDFNNYRKLHPENEKYIIRLLSRIHENRNNQSFRINLFLNKFSQLILPPPEEVNNQNGVKTLPQGSIRTPTEVIIDLLAYLNDSCCDKYSEITDKAKSMFLTHQLSIGSVRNFLKNVQRSYENSELGLKCQTLEEQLISRQIFTRFNDNIYGRVFDSFFVDELVKNPPVEVTKAMSAMSKGLAEYLSSLSIPSQKYEAICERIKKLLSKKEPRFWFPGVKELQDLQNSTGDVLAELIEYLRVDKKSGFECISIPYLLVNLSLILQHVNRSPPWLSKANSIYYLKLEPQYRNIRQIKKGKKTNTLGGGITLQYQPVAIHESWMIPSKRPVTVRKPNSNMHVQTFNNAKKSLDNSLIHGLPWASGISGSTNISLAAWEYFTKSQCIDPKACFLGIIMFLVYDGGHSIHEPLWAASQINENYNLKFDLGGSKEIEKFISDYEKFYHMYEEDLKERICHTFERSFERTVDYFNTHSLYKSSYIIQPRKNGKSCQI